MLKKVLLVLFFAGCVSCPGHHNSAVFLDNKKNKIYKTSFCEPENSFPQMIVVPFFGRATQIVPNCQTYPKHKTSLALMVFYHHWVKSFGDENLVVKKALEKIMIEWGVNKKVVKKGYSLDGKERRDVTVVGMTKTKSYIWVWQGYNHKISESSLIHELVHVALRAKNGHGDSDHEGDIYHGWTKQHTTMILEAKEVLRSFNI
ncbi:MAG: hypothetical protein VYC40_01905 [Pseudomonadota bacterium]|nr:hypothetical protein [Pseudomonadota bacterium]